MHIAEINYVNFFRPVFDTDDEARAFISNAEQQNAAKKILYQAARMIWLADRLEQFTKGRPAVQILFYLIAAEACTKIAENFSGDGESKRHVLLFFEKYCRDDVKKRLQDGFKKENKEGPSFDTSRQMTVREIADMFYEIRCKAVHEGRYFDFFLNNDGEDGNEEISPETGDPISISMSLADLRQLILEGVVEMASRSMVTAGQPLGLATPEN